MNRRNLLKIGAVAALFTGCATSVELHHSVVPVEISQFDCYIVASSGMTFTLPEAAISEGRTVSIKNASNEKVFARSDNLIAGVKVIEVISEITVICDGTTWHKI